VRIARHPQINFKLEFWLLPAVGTALPLNSRNFGTSRWELKIEPYTKCSRLAAFTVWEKGAFYMQRQGLVRLVDR
jgi:hypothetical protein